jgi:hypothetical protein
MILHQSVECFFYTKCQKSNNLGSHFLSTNFLKDHDFFFILRLREVLFCRNKKKEKDRSRSRSRRRSRSRSRSRSGSRDKKKKKRKDRSRSRSGGDNKRKERDEAEKEAGEVHSDGERKKVRELSFFLD